jgi:hypothetical protein
MLVNNTIKQQSKRNPPLRHVLDWIKEMKMTYTGWLIDKKRNASTQYAEILSWCR